MKLTDSAGALRYPLIKQQNLNVVGNRSHEIHRARQIPGRSDHPKPSVGIEYMSESFSVQPRLSDDGKADHDTMSQTNRR